MVVGEEKGLELLEGRLTERLLQVAVRGAAIREQEQRR